MRISKSTNIEASTTDVLEPTVDNVLDLIENKKIIFKNDVAYWSRGKRVLPKEYRACIEQTQYAHWINEWSCEQAEKFGDRAYYDYDGDTEVKASNMRISKSDKTSVKASNLIPSQRTAVDGKTWWVVYDTDTKNYSTLTCFGKYKTKKDCQYAIDNYINPDDERDLEKMKEIAQQRADKYGEDYIILQKHNGRYTISPKSLRGTIGGWKEVAEINSSVDACGDIKGSTSTDKALQHIKAAIDILGKSGNKDSVTKDSIANLATVMFDLKSSDKGDK